MGAGKGKGRRSMSADAPLRPILTIPQIPITPEQGTSPSPSATPITEKVTTDRAAWEKFVKKSGMSNLKLRDYYLDGSRGGTALKNSELLARAIFADLVAVGAIKFPAGMGEDNFRLEAKKSKPYQGASTEIQMLMMQRVDTGEERSVIRHPEYNLNGDTKFSHRGTRGTVSKLLAAVKNLAS